MIIRYFLVIISDLTIWHLYYNMCFEDTKGIGFMNIETGYSVLLSKETEKIKQLDCNFISMLENYKVNEWTIPSLIDGQILRRCGYFSTLPNHLTKVGFIKRNRLQVVTDNHSDISCDDIDNTSNTYLTPAACLHLYPMLEKYPIHNEVITTLAKVYRYENGNFTSKERQWEFSVREFVAVGNIEYVKTFLEEMEKKLYNYALTLYNSISVEYANDHFYPTKQNEIKSRFQLKNKLKRELIVNCDKQRLAISSFNYHEYHFSKEFNFDNNEEIVTGCVGCGLERWLRFMEV